MAWKEGNTHLLLPRSLLSHIRTPGKLCSKVIAAAHCENYIVEVTIHLSSHDLLSDVSTAITHDQQMHSMTI